jgi:hypothetical protein
MTCRYFCVQTKIDLCSGGETCPGAVDMCNLAQMLAHVHDAEIEIGEGPEPPLRDQHIRKTADVNSAEHRRINIDHRLRTRERPAPLHRDQ